MDVVWIIRNVALGSLAGLGLLVALLGLRMWDNGRERVHSSEQAVDMAKAAAGPSVAGLPYQVERDQDGWTVRFGPDQTGQVHSYYASIWDKQAGPMAETDAWVELSK